MADSKSDPNSFSAKEVEAPNLLERAKEEFEALLHPRKSPCRRRKESHGQDNGIDEKISVDDVKAPNVFERAKDEFEAIAQVFQQKKDSSHHDKRDEALKTESKHKQETSDSPSRNDAKAANPSERANEEIESIIHHDNDKSQRHHHHKETHGMSDGVDENTPIDDVKGPNVFERIKEEFEAIFGAMHPKKEK